MGDGLFSLAMEPQIHPLDFDFAKAGACIVSELNQRSIATQPTRILDTPGANRLRRVLRVWACPKSGNEYTFDLEWHQAVFVLGYLAFVPSADDGQMLQLLSYAQDMVIDPLSTHVADESEAPSARPSKKSKVVDRAQIIVVWMPSFPVPAGVRIPAPLMREMLSRHNGETPNDGFSQSKLLGVAQRFYRRPERFIEGVLEWGGVKGYFVEKRDKNHHVEALMDGPGASYTIRNSGGDYIHVAHKNIGRMLIEAIGLGPGKPKEMLDILRKHVVEA